MIRRHAAWVGILAVLPFLGGVQNCNRAVDPTTSGEQTADETGTETATETETTDTSTGEDGTATTETGEETGEGVVEAPPQLSRGERAQGMFNEGLLALSVRPPQVQTAIDRFDQVAQMMPDWAEAHYNLGLAHLEGRNTTKAIKSLEEATRLQPGLGDAWVALGTAYEKENRTGAAMDAYSQCTRHDPKNTECMLGSVRYSFEQGENPDSIVRAIQDILVINSTSVGAYVLLALTYMRQGEPKLAQFALLKAQQANEAARSDPIVHCNMGMIYRQMGLEFEAEQAFNAALEQDPNHVQTLVNLANIRIFNLDFEGAKLLVQRAVIQNKNHIGARLALGIAKRGTGDLDGAKAEFEQVLATDPGNTDAQYNLAVLYGDHYRDWPKALDAYNELLRMSPGLAEDDPIYTYIEEVEKSQGREERRLERERRRQEKDEQKRIKEQERAAEEARKAAEEAAARAAEAVSGAGDEAGTGEPDGGGGDSPPTEGGGSEGAPPAEPPAEEAPAADSPAAGEGAG